MKKFIFLCLFTLSARLCLAMNAPQETMKTCEYAVYHFIKFNLAPTSLVTEGYVKHVADTVLNFIDPACVVRKENAYPTRAAFAPAQKYVVIYTGLTGATIDDITKKQDFWVPENGFFFDLDCYAQEPDKGDLSIKNGAVIRRNFESLASSRGYVRAKDGKRLSFNDWEAVFGALSRETVQKDLQELGEGSLDIEMKIGDKEIYLTPRKMTQLQTKNFLARHLSSTTEVLHEIETYQIRRPQTMSFFFMAYGENRKIYGLSKQATDEIFLLIDQFWQHFFQDEISRWLCRNCNIPVDETEEMSFTGSDLRKFFEGKASLPDQFSSKEALEQLQYLAPRLANCSYTKS